jgi:hypothetical protein
VSGSADSSADSSADFIVPQGWIAREKCLHHMRSISENLDIDPVYLESASRADSADDNDRFEEAVAAFLGAWVDASH